MTLVFRQEREFNIKIENMILLFYENILLKLLKLRIWPK